MNRILIAVFTVGVLLSGSLLAQSPQPASPPDPPNQEQAPQQPQTPSAQQPVSPSAPDPTASTAATANGTPKIAAGSVIPVQLTRSIDAKKAKKGDEVVAKVTQDMRSGSGTVVVAKDTTVVGHVTEAQARSKEQKESEVAIAFDRMVPKNGEPMRMPMSIQAIIASPRANSANSPSAQPASTQPTTGYPETGSGSSVPSGRAESSTGTMGGTMGGNMGGTPPSTTNVPQSTGREPAERPSGTQAQQPITGNTKGVVGIANMTLSTAADTGQGSVVSSEKNNVKLDDGTFLLLRVNQ